MLGSQIDAARYAEKTCRPERRSGVMSRILSIRFQRTISILAQSYLNSPIWPPGFKDHKATHIAYDFSPVQLPEISGVKLFLDNLTFIGIN